MNYHFLWLSPFNYSSFFCCAHQSVLQRPSFKANIFLFFFYKVNCSLNIESKLPDYPLILWFCIYFDIANVKLYLKMTCQLRDYKYNYETHVRLSLQIEAQFFISWSNDWKTVSSNLMTQRQETATKESFHDANNLGLDVGNLNVIVWQITKSIINCCWQKPCMIFENNALLVI